MYITSVRNAMQSVVFNFFLLSGQEFVYNKYFEYETIILNHPFFYSSMRIYYVLISAYLVSDKTITVY